MKEELRRRSNSGAMSGNVMALTVGMSLGMLVGLPAEATNAQTNLISEGRHCCGRSSGLDADLTMDGVIFTAADPESTWVVQLNVRLGMEEGSDWNVPPQYFVHGGTFKLGFGGDPMPEEPRPWRFYVYWKEVGGTLKASSFGPPGTPLVPNGSTMFPRLLYIPSGTCLGGIPAPCVEFQMSRWSPAESTVVLKNYGNAYLRRMFSGGQALVTPGVTLWDLEYVSIHNQYKDWYAGWSSFDGRPEAATFPLFWDSAGLGRWEGWTY